MFTLWRDSDRFARYIIQNTRLREHESDIERRNLPTSDANNPREFHKVPDRIKDILYLDAPDLIVESDREPLFTIEISEEAGTGHNSFQRFPRIAASVESSIPSLYIYPEATYITRQSRQGWDEINPLVFKALESAMQIHDVPALLFYYPSEFDGTDESPSDDSAQNGLLYDSEFSGQPDHEDPEMQQMFDVINAFVDRSTGETDLDPIKNRPIRVRRNWMQQQYVKKGGPERTWSPLTATQIIPTSSLIEYLESVASECESELLNDRDETVIYSANAQIRGDPYTGGLVGVDYLKARIGESYKDRDRNLVFCWGSPEIVDGSLEVTASNPDGSSVEAFVDQVQLVTSDRRLLLDRDYRDLENHEIPRYYMQVRHGTRFTQKKLIRCFAYFADAIIFHDGGIWRDG